MTDNNVYVIVLTESYEVRNVLVILASNYKQFKVLVVDNASQDGTAEIVRENFLRWGF
jgi:glycosyltransferase involved in cell wall biosynthesis